MTRLLGSRGRHIKTGKRNLTQKRGHWGLHKQFYVKDGEVDLKLLNSKNNVVADFKINYGDLFKMKQKRATQNLTQVTAENLKMAKPAMATASTVNGPQTLGSGNQVIDQ